MIKKAMIYSFSLAVDVASIANIKNFLNRTKFLEKSLTDSQKAIY